MVSTRRNQLYCKWRQQTYTNPQQTSAKLTDVLIHWPKIRWTWCVYVEHSYNYRRWEISTRLYILSGMPFHTHFSTLPSRGIVHAKPFCFCVFIHQNRQLSEILLWSQTFVIKKHKIICILSRWPSCLGLNVLNECQTSAYRTPLISIMMIFIKHATSMPRYQCAIITFEWSCAKHFNIKETDQQYFTYAYQFNFYSI